MCASRRHAEAQLPSGDGASFSNPENEIPSGHHRGNFSTADFNVYWSIVMMETVRNSNRSPRLTESLPKPTPLSPAEFQAVAELAGGGPSTEMSGTTADQNTIFTGSDRFSLQVFLNLLRSSRVEAKNPDVEVAMRGKKRLVMLISYLVGFLDARGLTENAAINSGFDLLISSNVKPDMNLLLDDLEAVLVKAVTEETRSGVTSVLHGVADLGKRVGGSMVGAGILAEVGAMLL
jgi:hypothetical protein